MTDAELAAIAIAEYRKTSIDFPEYVHRCLTIPGYKDQPAHWKKALDALARMGQTPPPPPPPRSVFAGVGIFANERPRDAIGLPVDWVAVRAPLTTWNDAKALRDAGKRVFAWDEAANSTPEGPGAVARLEADGYVWTVETGAQLADTPPADEPRAIIGNTAANPFPHGWHCAAEGYSLINPAQTCDQMVRDMRARGATEISVCVLPADRGLRVPLSWYDAQIRLAIAEGAVGASVFRVETLGPGDVDYLLRLRTLFA